MKRMIQAPNCCWITFVDTRGKGDLDFFTERDRTRDDARRTAAGHRKQGGRVAIRGGGGGFAIVPNWYVPNAFDRMAGVKYLNGPNPQS